MHNGGKKCTEKKLHLSNTTLSHNGEIDACAIVASALKLALSVGVLCVFFETEKRLGFVSSRTLMMTCIIIIIIHDDELFLVALWQQCRHGRGMQLKTKFRKTIYRDIYKCIIEINYKNQALPAWPRVRFCE